jgi:hypothetical protein
VDKPLVAADSACAPLLIAQTVEISDTNVFTIRVNDTLLLSKTDPELPRTIVIQKPYLL